MFLQKILKPVFGLLITLLITTNSFAHGKTLDNADDDFDYNYAALNNRCAVYDPYERLNRKLFVINGVLDFVILRPIAKVYIKVTNDYTKNRIGSVVNNVREPLSMVNFLFQKKPQGALKSFWRFAINTTLGVGGLFDVAGKVGLKQEAQTFGNTLAHYGVGPGPYIVLPIFGGHSSRDTLDHVTLNSRLNPLNMLVHKDFKYITSGVRLVHERYKNASFIDYVRENSTDPYITVRDATLNSSELLADYPFKFKCPTVGGGLSKD